MADVVFILGAGCSFHAGAPLMSNFLQRARELHAAGKVADMDSEFRLVFETIKNLERVNTKANLDFGNIEWVFSAIDFAQTMQKLPGALPSSIGQVREALVWTIVRTLEATIMFEPSERGSTRGTEEYARFAALIRKLKKRASPLSSAVISFNYDVACDVSFETNELPFTYGLDDLDSGQVPLLKMHGSLNWFRLAGKGEEGTRVHAYPIDRYLEKYKLMALPGSGYPAVLRRVAWHCAKEWKARLHNSDAVPVLVPPTWSKGEHHRDISPVWIRAGEELEEAQHIFVLGYSLPETDQFFRLFYALGAEGKRELRSFHVFDPNVHVFNPKNGSVEQRFRAILGPRAEACFKPLDKKFGEGIDIIDQYLNH